jgi:hypothetical protein
LQGGLEPPNPIATMAPLAAIFGSGVASGACLMPVYAALDPSPPEPSDLVTTAVFSTASFGSVGVPATTGAAHRLSSSLA